VLSKKTSSIIDNIGFMSDRNSERSRKRANQIQKQKDKRSQSSNNLPTNNKVQELTKKNYTENSETNESNNNNSDDMDISTISSVLPKRHKSMIQQPNQFIMSKHAIYTPTVDHDAEQVVSDLDGDVGADSPNRDNNTNNTNTNSNDVKSNNLKNLKPLIAKSKSNNNNSFIPIKNTLQTKKLIKSENATPSYLLLMEFLNDNNGDSYNNENNENYNNSNSNGVTEERSRKHSRTLSHGNEVVNNKIDVVTKAHLRLPSVNIFINIYYR